MHVSARVPLHSFDPGTQTPEQTPFPVQTYGQVEVVAHEPEALHVWTFSAEHWVAPVMQLPAHAPAEHTKGHACVFCQVPVASQV